MFRSLRPNLEKLEMLKRVRCFKLLRKPRKNLLNSPMLRREKSAIKMLRSNKKVSVLKIKCKHDKQPTFKIFWTWLSKMLERIKAKLLILMTKWRIPRGAIKILKSLSSKWKDLLISLKKHWEISNNRKKLVPMLSWVKLRNWTKKLPSKTREHKRILLNLLLLRKILASLKTKLELYRLKLILVLA